MRRIQQKRWSRDNQRDGRNRGQKPSWKAKWMGCLKKRHRARHKVLGIFFFLIRVGSLHSFKLCIQCHVREHSAALEHMCSCFPLELWQKRSSLSFSEQVWYSRGGFHRHWGRFIALNQDYSSFISLFLKTPILTSCFWALAWKAKKSQKLSVVLSLQQCTVHEKNVSPSIAAFMQRHC